MSVARQRVDHRDADAVQTAGDLVAAAAELAAGVQHGQRHRQRRAAPGPGAVSVGMPRPLSSTRIAAVGLEGEDDPVAVAGQRLVDRVVHDLPDQVVQAALAGGADVHAGALADRLEALEHLDRGGVVLDAVGGLRGLLLLGQRWTPSRPGLRRTLLTCVGPSDLVRDDPTSMIPRSEGRIPRTGPQIGGVGVAQNRPTAARGGG